MAISRIGQLLVDFLETSKGKEPEKTLAYLATGEDEDKMLALCQYLHDNPEANGAEILAAARRIATL